MSNHNFDAIIKEIQELHWQKNKDYGQDHDPYANIRGSQDWGISAWKGAMVRANDKIKRLQKFAQTGELANESVEDSFKDLAVYALIGLDLYRQEQVEKAKKEMPHSNVREVMEAARYASDPEDIFKRMQKSYEPCSEHAHGDPGDETTHDKDGRELIGRPWPKRDPMG